MKQKRFKYTPTPEEQEHLFNEKLMEIEMCIRTAKESMDQYIEQYKSLKKSDFSQVERVVSEGDVGYDEIDAPEIDSDFWI